MAGAELGKPKVNGFLYMPSENIPLVELPRALLPYGARCTYQQAWKAIVAGEFPAERDGSRWLVRSADLPEIARALSASR